MPAREPTAPVPEAPAPAAQDGGRRSAAAAPRAAPPDAAATRLTPLDPARTLVQVRHAFHLTQVFNARLRRPGESPWMVEKR